MEHARGEVLADRYELRDLIARGPTTLTYAALDRHTGRNVSVRHWPAGVADDAKAAAEFERQVVLAKTLGHVHLARGLDQFANTSSGGTERYLVHDAEGEMLTDWSHAGLRDEGDMRTVATALLRALEVMHAKGFVHGRVCGEEVLRRADGRLYLTGAAADADTHGGPSADLRALGQLLLAITPFARLASDPRSWLEWLLSSDDKRGFASAADALRALQKAPKRGARRVADYALVAAAILTASGGWWVVRTGVLHTRRTGAASEVGAAVADTRFVPKPPATAPKLQLSHVVSMAGHWSVAMQVAFDREGKRLATASFDGSARLWNANDGSALAAFTHTGKVGTVTFLSDDRLISGGGTEARIWNAATGELVRTLAGDAKQVTQVRATRDGRYVVVAGFEGKIGVFDAASGELVRTMQQPPRVLALALDPSGEHIASAGSDGVVRVFRFADGSIERELRGHTQAVDALAFSPDGHTLVSAADDHSVRIWFLPASKLMRTLKGHRDEVWAVAIDPAGKQIASGSKDGEVRLWDMYTGELLLSKSADARGVTSVAYSPDGQRLAVAGGSQRLDVYALIVQRPSWQPPPITAPVKKAPPAPPPKDASPELVLVYQARALVDDSHGDHRNLIEANALLQRALVGNPRLAAAYVESARIAYKAGYLRRDEYRPEALEKADELLKRALELEPDSYDAYERLAALRMFQKDYAGATQAAQRCEQLRPGDTETQMLFMDIAEAQDQDEQVMLHARAMIAGSPTQRQLAAAYGKLCDIYKRRGEYDAAETMYRSEINLDPDSAWTKGNYADFLIQRERYDDAITWARAALAQMDYGMAHLTLGEAYANKARVALEHGKRADCDSELAQAFNADPRSAEGHYVRGLVFRRDHDENAARREFTLALESDPDHDGAKLALR